LAGVNDDPSFAFQGKTGSIADKIPLPMGGSIGKQPLCVNGTLRWFISIELDKGFRVQSQEFLGGSYSSFPTLSFPDSAHSVISTIGGFMKSMMLLRNHRKPTHPVRRGTHARRMPIVLLLTIFLFLALIGSLACAESAFSYGQKSFLWKVQSTGSTVYLLGSIHFMKEDVYPLNQAIEIAYESSDKLVVEANINDLGNLDLKKLADRAFYKSDDNVEKHVSPETYRLIKKESKALGLPLDLLRMQKPWFLALSFQAMELVRLGYSPEHGVDYHFLRRAQGKKKILELESLEEQLSLLSGFSDREQEQFLLYTLDTLSTMDRQVGNMVRAWTSGDAQAMESALADALPPDPSLAPIVQKLFDERNLRMLPKIEGYLNSNGTYFVIVGAGHLVGKKGIVALLKSKGYTLEQF
jgi:uncharacterized protein YbaP (TraB family)